jgi:hypothetical protein
MEESDTLSLRAHSRALVNELNSGRSAPLEHPVEIVYRKADVMYPGPAFRDEACDRRVGIFRLQQLD